MNYCETCKFYHYKPNILGGISKCTIRVKPLMTFWKNEACGRYDYDYKKARKANNDNARDD